MKALSKVAAMLAALCMTGGTALAAPAAPTQHAPVVSEAKMVDSNYCYGFYIRFSDGSEYAEVTCYIYSDGSY